MKKIHFTVMAMLAAILFLAQGCVKDKGTYPDAGYDINRVKTTLPDGVNYMYYVGDMLSVIPENVSSKNNNDTANYSYEWFAVSQATEISDEAKHITLSRSRDLNYRIDLPFGGYTIFYRVTDKATNVYAESRFGIVVSEAFMTGWLVMCEVDGKMRLDMIDRRPEGNVYVQDALAAAGSTLPMEDRGKPIGFGYATGDTESPNSVALYLLTETGSNRINGLSFTDPDGTVVRPLSWKPDWNGGGHFISQFLAPENLIIQKYIAGDRSQLFIGNNGNMYYQYAPRTMYYSFPVNVYARGGDPVRIAPKVAGKIPYGQGPIIYEMDSKSLKRLDIQATEPVIKDIAEGDITVLKGYKNTGLDLVELLDNSVYMGSLEASYIYALMKDPANNDYHIIQAKYLNFSQVAYNVIGKAGRTPGNGVTNFTGAPDIDKATLFLVGGDWFNNFYYAVGNTVWSYSIAEDISRKALVCEDGDITYLKFQNGAGDLNRRIAVGTWNGTKGTLKFYRHFAERDMFMPLEIEESMQELFNNSAFGKIVDVHIK